MCLWLVHIIDAVVVDVVVPTVATIVLLVVGGDCC